MLSQEVFPIVAGHLSGFLVDVDKLTGARFGDIDGIGSLVQEREKFSFGEGLVDDG